MDVETHISRLTIGVKFYETVFPTSTNNFSEIYDHIFSQPETLYEKNQEGFFDLTIYSDSNSYLYSDIS